MKKLLFSCFVFLSFTNVSFSQCTEPPSTVNGIIDCAADQPTIAVLFVDGINPQWFDAEVGGNLLAKDFLLENGATYWAQHTGVGCTSERSSTTVTLLNPIAPIVLETSQEFCEANSPTVADIEVQLNDGSNSVLWYDSETSEIALSDTDLLDDGDYWAAEVTGTCGSTTRSKVTVVINIVPEPTTSLATQTFCESEPHTVTDLEAEGFNIKWYATVDSAVALNPTDILEEKIYYATQTASAADDCESATRLEVTVVIDTTPEPTTSSTTQSFCENEINTVADLEATGTDIKWYATAISTDPLNTTDELVAGNYYATQTAGAGTCESATRLVVTVEINETPEPTTSSATQTFCIADSHTVGDLEVTGSNIKWYPGPTSIIPLNSTDILVDGIYYATQTIGGSTSCESETRLAVTVDIITPEAPDTSSTTQTFCESEPHTVANLDVTGSGIKWYSDETSTVALNTTDELVTGTYYATQTTSGVNSCESPLRLEVSVVIESAPVPTTTSSTQSFCSNNTNTVADLQANGTNIKWYATATSTVALNSTDVLVAGDYFATQTTVGTTGCESPLRLVVSVVLEDTPEPTTSSSNQSFCSNEPHTVANLNVTGSDIKWYDTATSTVALNSTDELVTGDYYATQTTGGGTGCESVSRTRVDVVVVSTLAPELNGSVQVFCKASDALVSNLNALGSNIKWYDSPTSTVELSGTEVLVSGNDYYATQSEDPSLGCTNLGRAKLTVIIGVTPPVPTTSSTTDPQVFCFSDFPNLSNLDVNETNIRWYDSPTSIDVLDNNQPLEDGKTYYATQVSVNGCESDTRLPIAVSVTSIDTPSITTSGEEFCLLEGSFTLSDLNDKVSANSDNTIVWYDDVLPQGNVLDLSEPLIHNNIYYAYSTEDSNDSSACKSAIPLILQVNLEACDDDALGIFDGFSPNDDSINDEFTTGNILTLYPDYTINFYNRWGNIVYEGGAAKPYWNGRLKGDGELLPEGIYYYIIDFKKNDKEPKQGSLYLSR